MNTQSMLAEMRGIHLDTPMEEKQMLQIDANGGNELLTGRVPEGTAQRFAALLTAVQHARRLRHVSRISLKQQDWAIPSGTTSPDADASVLRYHLNA